MLLRIETHEETRHVHDLLAHTNVALLDEHARVVDGLGETLLEHEGLQSALEEVRRRHRQHEIKLHLRLVEKPVALHAAHDTLALEDALRIVLVECENVTHVGANLV